MTEAYVSDETIWQTWLDTLDDVARTALLLKIGSERVRATLRRRGILMTFSSWRA